MSPRGYEIDSTVFGARRVWSAFTLSIKSLRERPNLSSFKTTSESPSRRKRMASARPSLSVCAPLATSVKIFWHRRDGAGDDPGHQNLLRLQWAELSQNAMVAAGHQEEIGSAIYLVATAGRHPSRSDSPGRSKSLLLTANPLKYLEFWTIL